VDPFTRQIFSTGDENRAVARLLAAQDASIADAARRWATISAFYAAVHYINAWLWEHLQVEPRDHTERRVFVLTVSTLKPAANAYVRLQDHGYDARYRIGVHISPEKLNGLLEGDVRTVRSIVIQSLNARQ
jgi:hypothetical protein